MSPVHLRSEVESSYAHCVGVTRTRARNFWWGIRLLEPEKRRALCAVYACARLIDDIADGDLPAPEKHAELTAVRRRLETADAAGDPVLTAVFDAARRLPVPLDAFTELITGCTADVAGTTYHTWDETLLYCRRVAGSIGRLCVGVFGATDQVRAPRFADSLGIALQLVNILRDLREDRRNGRIYLPLRELARHGVRLGLDGHGDFTDPPERLAAVYRVVAATAREWYADGLRLLPLLDRRSAWCCGTLAGVYEQLLTTIEADPLAAAHHRVSVPAHRLALAVTGAARQRRDPA